jgi:hypothetical protein
LRCFNAEKEPTITEEIEQNPKEYSQEDIRSQKQKKNSLRKIKTNPNFGIIAKKVVLFKGDPS